MNVQCFYQNAIYYNKFGDFLISHNRRLNKIPYIHILLYLYFPFYYLSDFIFSAFWGMSDKTVVILSVQHKDLIHSYIAEGVTQSS